MTLEQAIDRLFCDPADGPALGVVRRAVEQMALGPCRGRREEAEDVVQDVLIAFLEKLQAGSVQREGSVAGLLKTMVLRTCVDHRRRRDGRGEAGRIPWRVDVGGALDGDPPPAAGMPAAAPSLLEIDPLALLDTLIDDAIARRRPQDRASLQRAADELRLRLLSPRSFAAIVADHERLAPERPPPRPVMARAYKRQQRLREALVASAEALAAEGRLDDAQVALASDLARLLVYCQKSGPSSEPIP